MGPPVPWVKSAYASSSSLAWAVDEWSRAWNFRAQIAKKESYWTKPSESGSRMEMNSASSSFLGGMPRALARAC